MSEPLEKLIKGLLKDRFASYLAPQWRKFGVAAGLEEHELNIIDLDYNGDVREKCSRMLSLLEEQSTTVIDERYYISILQKIKRVDIIRNVFSDCQQKPLHYHSNAFIDMVENHKCFGREKEMNAILKFAFSKENKDKHLVVSGIPGLGKTELFRQALNEIYKLRPDINILYPTLNPTEENKENGLQCLLANIYEGICPGSFIAEDIMATVTHLLSNIAVPTILALDVSSVNMPQSEIKLLFQFIEKVLKSSSNLKIINLRCKPPEFDIFAKRIILKKLSEESVISLIQFHNCQISREDCIRIFRCFGGYPYILCKIAKHTTYFPKPAEDLETFLIELEANPERAQLKINLCLKDDFQILFEQLRSKEKETLIQLSHFNELIPNDILEDIFDSSVSFYATHLWLEHCLLEQTPCTRFFKMGRHLRSFIRNYCGKTQQYLQLLQDSKFKVIRFYTKLLNEFDHVFFAPNSLKNCQQLKNLVCYHKANCNKLSSECVCDQSQIIFGLFQKMKPNIILFLKRGFLFNETLIETVDTCCRTVHLLKNLLHRDELQSLYIDSYGKVSKSLQDDKVRLAVMMSTIRFLEIYHNVTEDQDRNILELTQVIKCMEMEMEIHFKQLRNYMLHNLSFCYINRGYLRGFSKNQYREGVNDIIRGKEILKLLPNKGRYLITTFSSSGYMAALYYQQGLFEQSIQERNHQIDGYRTHLATHPLTAKAIHYQANAFMKINEYISSVNYCYVSYKMYKQLRGIGVETTRVLLTYGKGLRKLNNIKDSIFVLKKAITEGVKVLGKQHHWVGRCYQELAIAEQAAEGNINDIGTICHEADDLMRHRKKRNNKNSREYVLQYSIEEIDLNCLELENESLSKDETLLKDEIILKDDEEDLNNKNDLAAILIKIHSILIMIFILIIIVILIMMHGLILPFG